MPPLPHNVFYGVFCEMWVGSRSAGRKDHEILEGSSLGGFEMTFYPLGCARGGLAAISRPRFLGFSIDYSLSATGYSLQLSYLSLLQCRDQNYFRVRLMLRVKAILVSIN